jgi:heat shock protein HspQ
MKHKLAIGTIVHHNKYGYRGVIASFDPMCQADDVWYSNNRTQPSRNQPWYHVLVDGADTTTYVAEENLELAAAVEPVQHPLLMHFFSTYYQGRYYTLPLN